jgi:hypothetical protein
MNRIEINLVPPTPNSPPVDCLQLPQTSSFLA